MAIAYYQDENVEPQARSARLLSLICMVDLIIALTVLFMWTAVSFYFAEPLAWATWMPVRRGTQFVELFEYPFVLLWAMPLACIGIAWFAKRSGKRALALTAALFPIVVLGMIYGWYHLVPIQYH